MLAPLLSWGRWAWEQLPPARVLALLGLGPAEPATAGTPAPATEPTASPRRLGDGGTAPTGTVAFGLDGAAYEVDLDDEQARELRAALAPFVAAARAVRPVARAPRRPASRSAAPDAAAVRAWARENGVTVNERGRLKGSVVAQYLEANR